MDIKLPSIRISNIVLRELQRSDYVDLFRIGKSEEVCKYLNWGPYKRINEALYVMDEIYLKRPLDNLPIGYAIVIDNVMRGLVEYHSNDITNNSIEIGYFLEESYFDKGIMTKVLKKAIKVAFNELNYDKVIISSLVENERNIKLILRLKLEYEKEELFLVDDDVYKLGRVYSIYKKDFKED